MAATFDLLSPFKYFNIAPVTDWERFINPQFNITINQGDAAIENHVLATAGSYGKQIGRMQEVLDIVVARIDTGTLTAVQQRSVEKYKETRAQVVVAVEAAKPSDGESATGEDVDGWLDRLATLRDSDPDQFDRLAARIGQFLAEGVSADAAAARTAPSRKRKTR